MYVAGSKVVHPFHGAGTITSIEKKSIGDRSNSYYVIASFADSSTQVLVPVDAAEHLGLRQVGKAFMLRRKLEFCLKEPPTKDQYQSNFRARKATLSEKLNSGRFGEVVSAVRMLFFMSTWRKLCATDRRFIDQGKEMLASELALACDMCEEEAMKELEERLHEMMSEDEEDKAAEAA